MPQAPAAAMRALSGVMPPATKTGRSVEGREAEAGRFAGAALGILAVTAWGLALVGMLLAPVIARVFYFSWDPDQQALLVRSGYIEVTVLHFPDASRFHNQTEHAPGRIGKSLLRISTIGHDADIGRMLDKLKVLRHRHPPPQGQSIT